MSHSTEWTLDEATHNRIYAEKIFPESGFQETAAQKYPRAIVLAGQPGAGKGGLASAVEKEFTGNVVKLDLDETRKFHRDVEKLRETHPYTWASHTHQDARGWTDKLNHAFVEGRRNIVFDTTLGGADHWIGEMKKMQALPTHPYEVEVRVLATHRLESEHGVHERFARDLDNKGYGRFVPQEVRSSVYDSLPANLDKVHAQLPDARIRIYNREGAELYDSRTSPLKPGAALAQAREARLTDPERTRGLNHKWQKQQAWEQQLPEALPRHPKVTPPTAQNVLRENNELKIKTDVQRGATEAAAVDRAVRIEPGIARVHLGLKVAGAAAQIPDAITTGREASRLLDQGNLTGAQSQVMHFAGRGLGMAGGAMAVGSIAAAAGIETGPGAVALGLAGGVIGAVAGDRIMDAADQARIHSQRGSDGNVWKLDPQHPEQGWTRLPRPGEFGPQGPSEAAGYKSQLMHAAPRLADEVNYKASSTAVELALARGPALQDPFQQPPESTGEAVLPGRAAANQPWLRDPQSHAWTRQTFEPATPLTHGMPVQRTVTASPEQALQLDRAAQAAIAHNIAQGPRAIAARYQNAYDQHGWKQHGPVPAAVLDAAQTPPDQLPASDGHTYTRGKDGQWTTPGSLYGTNTAQGPVRDELEATRQQMASQGAPLPAPTRPAAHREPAHPVTTHEQRITPTPGGMPFVEAHKRRDEPEQISVGSLQAVGKLDPSTLVKGSPSYRMHQAQEQDLMRGLALAQQQDRDRFRHEPSPSPPSVNRTQERTQGRLLSDMPVQKQFEPEVKMPAAPSRQQTSAPAIPAAAPSPVGVAPPVVPASAQSAALPPAQPISSHEQSTITLPQPTAQAGAGDSPEMQARWAAKEAELVAAREQIAQLSGQRNDERPAVHTEPAAPMRQTDPRDPAHPDHKDFQKIYGVVVQHGRWDAQQSASIASQALADFKAQPLSRRLDVVALEPDTNGRLKLIVGHAPWGGLRCLSSAMVDPVQAARMPAEQGFEQLAQATQQRELQVAQSWSQQQQQGNEQGFRR
ncbi:zeta toxin family protein [Variovorax sp. UMC13]|uniref:zeta toxin family protein n=1 Tax=Variovorax sp. UMC13 TaxID=1862326 RepID=UPI001602941D|nr:zeta toxin family protein [Variovorax sp. UMC13]